MGWAVLYIAFGIVALWLLGEVLFQFKARLRWRLLAFGGFVCVVAGAAVPSLVLLGLGIVAFAAGQTFVTLSHRRGFEAGWALDAPHWLRPGGRRRSGGAPGPMPADLDPEAYEPPPAGGSDDPPTGPLGHPFPDFPDSQEYDLHGVGPDGYPSPAYESVGYGGGYEPAGYPGGGYGTDGYGASPYEPAGATQVFAVQGHDAFPGDHFPQGPGDGYADDGYSVFGGPPVGTPPGFDPAAAALYEQQPQQPVPVYQPTPMPDETGEFTFGRDLGGGRYGAYADPYAPDAAASYGDHTDQGGGYGGYADHTGYEGHTGYADHTGYEGHAGYGGNGTGDPYGGQVPYGYDQFGGAYDDGTYGGGQPSYPAQTPPGGVWMPQQRAPEEQQQPYGGYEPQGAYEAYGTYPEYEQQPYPNGYGEQHYPAPAPHPGQGGGYYQG